MGPNDALHHQDSGRPGGCWQAWGTVHLLLEHSTPCPSPREHTVLYAHLCKPGKHTRGTHR